MVAGWLAPFAVGLSILLLGRAHYTLYVLKHGNRMSTAITWVATVLVVGFWAWKWLTP
jgi:hypothetical protein